MKVTCIATNEWTIAEKERVWRVRYHPLGIRFETRWSGKTHYKRDGNPIVRHMDSNGDAMRKLVRAINEARHD